MFLNLLVLTFRVHRGYSNMTALPPAAVQTGLVLAILQVRVSPWD